MQTRGNKGISLFNKKNGTFKEFFEERSIRGISAIYEDNNNNFWFTSFFSGLNCFNRNDFTVKTYNRESGLPANFINNILEDNSGKLWVSSHYGLSCFDPLTEAFRNYNEADGLTVTDFSQRAAYKSNDGTLYFGGEGGIISFQPEKLLKNKQPPDVVLIDFKIFGQSVRHAKNSRLEKHINVAEEINLSYRDNSISFEFAALDFTPCPPAAGRNRRRGS